MMGPCPSPPVDRSAAGRVRDGIPIAASCPPTPDSAAVQHVPPFGRGLLIESMPHAPPSVNVPAWLRRRPRPSILA